jgi:hypothetical protein
LGGNVRSSKIGDKFTIQYNRGIVVDDGGHFVSMNVGWDGGLVDQRDLQALKFFEGLECFDNFWDE